MQVYYLFVIIFLFVPIKTSAETSKCERLTEELISGLRTGKINTSDVTWKLTRDWKCKSLFYETVGTENESFITKEMLLDNEDQSTLSEIPYILWKAEKSYGGNGLIEGYFSALEELVSSGDPEVSRAVSSSSWFSFMPRNHSEYDLDTEYESDRINSLIRAAASSSVVFDSPVSHVLWFEGICDPSKVIDNQFPNTLWSSRSVSEENIEASAAIVIDFLQDNEFGNWQTAFLEEELGKAFTACEVPIRRDYISSLRAKKFFESFQSAEIMEEYKRVLEAEKRSIPIHRADIVNPDFLYYIATKETFEFTENPNTDAINGAYYDLLSWSFDRGLGVDRDPALAARILLSNERYTSPVQDPGIDYWRRFSVETVKEMQVTLRDLGFYKSSIDGIVGQGFMKAVEDLRNSCSGAGEPIEGVCTHVHDLPVSLLPAPRTPDR